jgi:sugar lactone lactonase YvrE
MVGIAPLGAALVAAAVALFGELHAAQWPYRAGALHRGAGARIYGAVQWILGAIVAVAVAASALAAPPAVDGLEPIGASPCIGTTTLATGCPVASPVLQGANDIAISPDGRTLYLATVYGGGAVVAVRRNADGTLGPVLGCDAAAASAGCATVVPSLFFPARIAVGTAGQVLVMTENGMSGAITALAVGGDGSLGGMIDCVVSPGGYSQAAGCTERPGLVLPLGITVGPGGTIYVASFGGYTAGTVIALATTADGAIGDELSCYSTTGINSSYACPSKSTGRIASPTNVIVGPGGTVYVTSSEYQATYGVVTAFPTDPGGALQDPANCVSDGGSYPVSPCGTTAAGIKGARAMAISPDGRLYVAASPYDGSSGTIAAFSLQAFGGIGAELNCLGSSVTTGCPTAPGLNGVIGLAVAPDGTVYTAANYSASDGAAAAFARQQNGALSNAIDCVGVTSATGCNLRMPGLAGANAIVGSPDPSMQDLYVAGRYASDISNPGTDGAVAALTRELAPVCAGGAATTLVGVAATVGLGCSDPNIDALTHTITAAPGHGTLGSIDDAAGTALYTPTAGFIGRDTFTVQASDGTLGSGIGTVTVDVSVDAVLHGAACAGASVPRAITAKLDRVTTLLERAEQQSNAKSATRLRRQAKHVLAGTGKAARKAAKGKKPKLAAACAAAIEQGVGEMAAGLSTPARSAPSGARSSASGRPTRRSFGSTS